MNTDKIKGRIHSTESFGASDGPGVRFVVFMQGCKMRCRYCHNPDTWDLNSGEEISADALLTRALRYKSFWRENGGITVSGGEPLLQIDFVTDFFRLAKLNGINTCIDTSGNPFTNDELFISKFNELLKYTDLFLLDIKEINPLRHKELTGFDNTNILDLARYLSDIDKPVWIRHVLVPGHSDFDEDLDKLGAFIKGLKNVKRVEVLPYHTLGRYKWDNLDLKYLLDGINPPSDDRVKNAEKRINASIRND